MSVSMIHATVRPESSTALTELLAGGGRRALGRIVLPLLVLAGLAWTFTAQASTSMSMAFTSFTAAWLVMMVAMMLPAVAPVVGLYAVVPVFLSAYLLVWAVSALPAYAVAQAVSDPLMTGRPWVARLTGATLLTAAVYQLTPLKTMCLRHCRSPLSFFLSRTRSLSRRRDAFTAGVTHGLYCLGCCWALMAVLVVLGGMQLAWALGLAAVITLEKVAPWGALAVRVTAVAAAGLGLALITEPSLLHHLVTVPMTSTDM
jgi:predicted metal-binding membrane protein